MANNCWNNVRIYDIKSENLDKIENWLKTYKDYNYFTDWCESIVSKENQIDTSKMSQFDVCYSYGTKWWDFSFGEETGVEISDEELLIQGDSAWGPPEGLCKALSMEFKCSVELECEESGCDFGAHIIFNNGEVDIQFNGTYRGYSVYDRGLQDSIQNDIEWIDDVEDATSVRDEYLGLENLTKKDKEVIRKEFDEFISELSLSKKE